MPVVMVHQGPTLTQERYEQVVRGLTGGKSRLESREDWPAEGILVHIAGQGENGFVVVDVWESMDAFARFGEVILPLMQDAGVTDAPKLFPAHSFVNA